MAGVKKKRRISRAEATRELGKLRRKYAVRLPSVEEFLREKHAEVDAGNREWAKILAERRSRRGGSGESVMHGANSRAKRGGKPARNRSRPGGAAVLSQDQLVRSICGKYAYVRFSSEDHIREKDREIEREG